VVSEQNVHLNPRGNENVMTNLAADLVSEF
jgi:hypothetical protein